MVLYEVVELHSLFATMLVVLIFLLNVFRNVAMAIWNSITMILVAATVDVVMVVRIAIHRYGRALRKFVIG